MGQRREGEGGSERASDGGVQFRLVAVSICSDLLFYSRLLASNWITVVAVVAVVVAVVVVVVVESNGQVLLLVCHPVVDGGDDGGGGGGADFSIPLVSSG